MVVPRQRADYPRVTHPSAALPGAEAPFSLDLHVLSLPLTFALSQDQTLQFILASEPVESIDSWFFELREPFSLSRLCYPVFKDRRFGPYK